MSNPIIRQNGNGSGLSSEDESLLTPFIRGADEVEAVARPAVVGKFWLEDEYEAGEEEQRHAYGKKAESESRQADRQAAALAHAAEKAAAESDGKHDHAAEARKSLQRDEEVLGPHMRRAPDAKILKWGRWALFLGGDIVGISGAALLLGEEPINAFMQATSAAASAVTLGGVGREVRYAMTARIRKKEPDELLEEEKPYAAWFRGPDAAATLIKMVVLVCLAGVLLIGGGIFALRDAAEGLGPAIAFSCLALALGLASFYNSFDTADDIAEHLDSKSARVEKIDKIAYKARENDSIHQRAAAETESRSIRAENEEAGEAAAAAVRRAMYAALGNSPGVAGNGPAVTESNGSSPNGRNPRPRRAKKQGPDKRRRGSK
jgi:hypothetical protein